MQEFPQWRKVQDGHVDVTEHANDIVDAMAGGNGTGFFVERFVQGPENLTNQQVPVAHPAEQGGAAYVQVIGQGRQADLFPFQPHSSGAFEGVQRRRFGDGVGHCGLFG